MIAAAGALLACLALLAAAAAGAGLAWLIIWITHRT